MGERDKRMNAGSLLAHPLVGEHRRRSAVGLAFLGTVVSMTVVSSWLSGAVVRSVRLETLTVAIDEFRAFIIVLVLASQALGVGYALWNGGPALAFSIPVVPLLVAGGLAGGMALETDLAVALGAGATGATVAVATTTVRYADGFAVRSIQESAAGLSLATAATVVAIVAALRTPVGTGPRFVVAAISQLVLVVGSLLLVVLWLSWLRGIVVPVERDDTSEPRTRPGDEA
jgi:hypothetical protein